MSMKKTTILMVLLVTMLALPLTAISAGSGEELAENEDFISIHTLTHHGLTMVLDGTTLIMLAKMSTTPEISEQMLELGNNMISEGRVLIDRALKGPVMVGLHVKGYESSPMMQKTHRLGELILKVVHEMDIIQEYLTDSETVRALEQILLQANQALMMASEGSNMVMEAKDTATNDLDRFSSEHGKKMIGKSRKILEGLLDSRLLENLGEKSKSPEEKKVYDYTTGQLQISLEIINLLAAMEH